MDSKKAIEMLLRKRVEAQERLNAPGLHGLTAGEYEGGAEFVDACNFAMDAIIERDGLARWRDAAKGDDRAGIGKRMWAMAAGAGLLALLAAGLLAR